MISNQSYMQFLERKKAQFKGCGLSGDIEIHERLFDYQKTATDYALRKGRAAMFLDTGLGKTLCQLEWAKHIPGDVLILAPLAVGKQTEAEAGQIRADASCSRDGKVKSKITIANYERAHLFDLSRFSGVVLDESSILKSFAGKTKQFLCESFQRTPYRLCCTATPAPNDYVELGNHSEFLGVMSNTSMLANWFTHDSGTLEWRLKRHGEHHFWQWIASWAACAEKPSDLGGDDSRHVLPDLKTELHQTKVDHSKEAGDGELFRECNLSSTSIHHEKRLTMVERCEKAMELSELSDYSIIWCESNEESKMLGKMKDCVEINGSQSIEEKEENLIAFSTGQVRKIVSKPSICGFGLNWQHCNNVIFASLSYSYESFYQAVRRSWRFGQKRPVTVHAIIAETELPIWHAIRRKMNAHSTMKSSMRQVKIADGVKGKENMPYIANRLADLPVWL